MNSAYEYWKETERNARAREHQGLDDEFSHCSVQPHSCTYMVVKQVAGNSWIFKTPSAIDLDVDMIQQVRMKGKRSLMKEFLSYFQGMFLDLTVWACRFPAWACIVGMAFGLHGIRMATAEAAFLPKSIHRDLKSETVHSPVE